MSQDDPFAGDSEKTVIRPSPAGRRGPARPSPDAAAGMPPPGEVVALPTNVGLNPLIGAATPLLTLAVRLRTMASVRSIDALRDRIVREIQNFERLVAALQMPREALRAAHYAICATVDDVINNTPWGRSAQWARQGMTASFHNDAVGGDRFFEFFNFFQRDPGRYREVLELMYLCLSLGFEGRLRVRERGASEHGQLRENVYTLLRRQRGEFERELSPQWRGLEAPHRPLTSFVPLWVIGVVAAAVLTLAYLLSSYFLNVRSDAVYAQFGSLPPPGKVTIKAEAPPPPPPPPRDGTLQRLRAFLAPEIRDGLVTLAETPQTATIRLRAGEMFGAGSATVNARFLPLLKSVAAALDHEPGAVLITGHTDNVPIRTARFPSNYHLSLARAEAVRAIIKPLMKEPQRLSVEGRADSDPIASNDTPEGRAANRRIELVLTKQEPGGR